MYLNNHRHDVLSGSLHMKIVLLTILDINTPRGRLIRQQLHKISDITDRPGVHIRPQVQRHRRAADIARHIGQQGALVVSFFAISYVSQGPGLLV